MNGHAMPLELSETRMRQAIWAGALAIVIVHVVHDAHASDPKAIVVGAALESATQTAAPMALVRVPLDELTTTSASQIGWTTQVNIERILHSHWAVDFSVAGTPWRAHQGNVVFEDGRRTHRGEFDAAAVRASGGVWFDDDEHLRAQFDLVALREWVGKLGQKVQARWDGIYGGGRFQVSAKWLRSDDPLRARADGLTLGLDTLALAGPTPWIYGRLEAIAGRRLGRFFLGGALSAFHVTADDAVNRVPVGGSWDVLGSGALYGFPLAAYRLSSAAIGSLRGDVRIIDALEVGVRGSVLAYENGLAYGGGAQLMMRLAGIDITVGAGLGGPDAFAPNIYATVRTLWLL